MSGKPITYCNSCEHDLPEPEDRRGGICVYCGESLAESAKRKQDMFAKEADPEKGYEEQIKEFYKTK